LRPTDHLQSKLERWKINDDGSYSFAEALNLDEWGDTKEAEGKATGALLDHCQVGDVLAMIRTFANGDQDPPVRRTRQAMRLVSVQGDYANLEDVDFPSLTVRAA
jgi:hypothetical protein